MKLFNKRKSEIIGPKGIQIGPLLDIAYIGFYGKDNDLQRSRGRWGKKYLPFMLAMKKNC
jgi:hypothetical protein